MLMCFVLYKQVNLPLFKDDMLPRLSVCSEKIAERLKKVFKILYYSGCRDDTPECNGLKN